MIVNTQIPILKSTIYTDKQNCLIFSLRLITLYTFLDKIPVRYIVWIIIIRKQKRKLQAAFMKQHFGRSGHVKFLLLGREKTSLFLDDAQTLQFLSRFIRSVTARVQSRPT